MKFLIPIIITLSSLVTISQALLSNLTDQQALLSFKSHITSDPYGVLQSWNPNTSFCNWEGVLCNVTKLRVTGLALANQSLVGTITPHLTNLSFLQLLDLQNNTLGGLIPTDLNRLFRLNTLLLRSNALQGTIPSSLVLCRRLRVLDLSTNKLQGSIPLEIGMLSELEDLSFAKNNLTGTIPPEFGNCSSLNNLVLLSNYMHGSVPHELGKLNLLLQLNLGDNNFSGEIPPSIYNISSLLILVFSKNRISGRLPSDVFTNLPSLETFFVGGNLLEGTIPASLSNNASNLTFLDLSVNNFTGQIPVFQNLPYIEIMNLEINNFDSNGEHGLDFITSLANSTFLRIFSVATNQLTGRIPSSVGNLSNQLVLLFFSENHFDGNVPHEIGNLDSLTQLSLEINSFDGSIPSTVGNLKNLQRFTSHSNNLSGPIPESIGNLTELFELNLSNNSLTGRIPTSLSRCQFLQVLDLSINKLDGYIPKEIFNIPNLGVILDLSRNSLTGPLPSEIGSLKMVQGIDVSDNRLSGTVPATIGDCSNLLFLDLARNSFNGHVLDSLTRLRGIEYIDVSSNNFSGTIPTSLDSLQFLQVLNLSRNHFHGEVPNKGVFLNSSAVSLEGNLELCGGTTNFKLPECATAVKKRSNRSKTRLVIGLVIGSIAIFIILSVGCFFLLLLLARRKRKCKQVTGDSASGQNPNGLYTYYDLRAATDNFSRQNMIGEGSFGSVFKGVLQDGTTIAVKVFKMDQHGAIKSFLAEIEALRNVRHRNLVKILNVCSTNDFKALVLRFMPNGSLEDWLHKGAGSRQHETTRLNLRQRLDIAIDVASAVDYLHYESGTPIVHCDLKPSNVLIDADMTAHVADFGLARILHDVSSSHHQSSTLGLKGSIGYIAPEYGLAGGVTTKGDVYSYGILILEMFTGRKPTSEFFKDGLTLQKWVASMLPNRSSEIFYVDLVEDCKAWGWDGLVYVINVGLSCAAEAPEDRPNMKDVCTRINKAKNMIYDNNE